MIDAFRNIPIQLLEMLGPNRRSLDKFRHMFRGPNLFFEFKSIPLLGLNLPGFRIDPAYGSESLLGISNSNNQVLRHTTNPPFFDIRLQANQKSNRFSPNWFLGKIAIPGPPFSFGRDPELEAQGAMGA